MTYAIGDIHGCNRTFAALLETLRLEPADRLILLGDYVDRGPDSKGVIDTIFQLRGRGFEVVCLRGNHEQLLLDALDNRDSLELWLLNGGYATQKSFGIRQLRDMPGHYLDFFTSTLYWYETGNYLCVHGGPDFSQPDPLGQPDRLMWMRRWYAGIDYGWLGKRIILHGHTPVEKTEIESQAGRLGQGQYLNLDNGCVYAGSLLRGTGIGNLAAFCLDDQRLFWQANVE